jgi:signal transduction histidine kinase
MDNGPGVPKEALDKLFNKFYRLPGSRSGGTGLGLTITRAIVEAHGGTITAKNSENGGLVISIILSTQ